MTAVQYRVAKPAVLSSGWSVIHTVTAGRYFTVNCIHLANPTAAAVTVHICIVPSGGAPSAANALLYGVSIPANDFVEFGEGVILTPLQTLQGYASAASGITAFAFGIEESVQGV